MLIPEKLKLNRFRMVSVPSKRSYFMKFGFAAAPVSQSFADGETPINAAGQTKLDAIAEAYDMHKDELDAPPAPDEE